MWPRPPWGAVVSTAASSRRRPRCVRRGRLDQRAVRVAHRVRPRRHDFHDDWSAVSRPSRRGSNSEDAQNPGSDAGKVLRLNDDGSVRATTCSSAAQDTSRRFTRSGSNALGLVVHPVTGESGKTRMIPRAAMRLTSFGRVNYGWPIILTAAPTSASPSTFPSLIRSPLRARPGATAALLGACNRRLGNDDVRAACFLPGRAISWLAGCEAPSFSASYWTVK